jgi:hypothetical protein
VKHIYSFGYLQHSALDGSFALRGSIACPFVSALQPLFFAHTWLAWYNIKLFYLFHFLFRDTLAKKWIYIGEGP